MSIDRLADSLRYIRAVADEFVETPIYYQLAPVLVGSMILATIKVGCIIHEYGSVEAYRDQQKPQEVQLYKQ